MKPIKRCNYDVQDCEYGWVKCHHAVEGNTEYCASHNNTLRKAERQAQKDAEKLASKILKAKDRAKQPRASVKKVSDKQKSKNEEYNARVKEWKKENPICDVQIPGVCTGKTDDCHHQKKRGDLLMVEKYWIPVCRSCHQWIGQNSDEARKRGLTINHLEPEFIEPHKI